MLDRQDWFLDIRCPKGHLNRARIVFSDALNFFFPEHCETCEHALDVPELTPRQQRRELRRARRRLKKWDGSIS